MRPGHAAGPPRSRGPHPHEIIDPDVDLHDPSQLAETGPREWDLLVAIALGGVLGAEARYGIGRLVPAAPGRFPWATLVVNLSGCVLIGAFMVLLLEVLSPHRLVRPFLGVGVLGGFTTFSTFGVDTLELINTHHAATALGYAAASVGLCLLAVHAATAPTRLVASAVIRRRRVLDEVPR